MNHLEKFEKNCCDCTMGLLQLCYFMTKTFSSIVCIIFLFETKLIETKTTLPNLKQEDFVRCISLLYT